MATRRKARRKSELSSTAKLFLALLIILAFLYLYSGGAPQTAQFRLPEAAIPKPLPAPAPEQKEIGLPNVIVQDVTFDSISARAGDMAQASVTFCNVGNGDAEAFEFTVLDAAENSGFAGSMTGLPAGECKTMPGFWQLTTSGTHTVTATIGNTNKMAESSLDVL